METESAVAPVIRRILVLRAGHIGDTVLVTPALELLNQLFPGAEISALVRAGAEPILQHHPLVKRIFIGGEMFGCQKMLVGKKRPLWRRWLQAPRGIGLIRELRRNRFDLAVDFNGGDRTALLAFFSGAARRIAYAATGSSLLFRDRLYTHLCRSPVQAKHKVLRDLELLCAVARATGREALAGELVPGPTVMHCSPEALAWARRRWSMIGSGNRLRVLVHPTARAFYKCWAAEKWAALIDRLRTEDVADVLVTSGPGPTDVAVARSVITSCQGKVPAHLGDLTLDRLAALIRQANLFLGVDTAPMHIAAAVGTRVVAVFGPSCDQTWRPWGAGHCVVRCRCPCLETRQRGCEEAEGMRCLNAVTVEEVYEAAECALEELAGVEARATAVSR